MSSVNWSAFVLSQLWNLPLVMVYLVGLVLSLIYWRRHRTVSILCAIAFLIFLGSVAIGSAMQLWQMAALESGSSYRDISQFLGVAGGVRMLLGTVAWALVLTALFGWRPATASQPNAQS